MSDIIDIYVTFYQRCIEAHVKKQFKPKIETLTTTTTVSHRKNGEIPFETVQTGRCNRWLNDYYQMHYINSMAQGTCITSVVTALSHGITWNRLYFIGE